MRPFKIPFFPIWVSTAPPGEPKIAGETEALAILCASLLNKLGGEATIRPEEIITAAQGAFWQRYKDGIITVSTKEGGLNADRNKAD